MTTLYIIIFAITLIYLAIANRPAAEIRLLLVQGLLLTLIASVQLSDLDWYHLGLIMLETFVVKTVAIPWYLDRLRKQNDITRTDAKISGSLSVIIITNIVIASFLLSSVFHNEHLQTKFYAIALAAMISGIYFIIINRSLFSHVIGYLVIENGIFLLSLAVGSEMPGVVTMAILLDILFGALMLGVFFQKVTEVFKSPVEDSLSQLGDHV